MTGQELIDLIQSQGDLSKDVKVYTTDGKFLEITGVDVECERDPFDGYFDKYHTVIKIEEITNGN
jgi:hypothetical protein